VAVRSFFMFIAPLSADVAELVEYVQQMADDILALDRLDLGTGFDTV